MLAKKALLDAETMVKPEDSNTADAMNTTELPDNGNDTSSNVSSQGMMSSDLSLTEMQR
jgi:hypothetical protein